MTPTPAGPQPKARRLAPSGLATGLRWLPVALVFGLAVVGKVLPCAAMARVAGFGPRPAWAIGFGMNARGAMEIVRGVAASGVAVGVVLHDLSAALRFADDAIALGEDGRVLAAGPVDEVLVPQVLERLFGIGFEVLSTASGRRAVVASA